MGVCRVGLGLSRQGAKPPKRRRVLRRSLGPYKAPRGRSPLLSRCVVALVVWLDLLGEDIIGKDYRF
jgi:hypothetical protein